MAQVILTKYWVLVHLLVTISTLCFIPVTSVTGPLWLVCSLLLMGLALPPVLRGESFYLARLRVSQALRGDAFVYASLLAVLYVFVGMLNGPRALVYASELRRWLYAVPPLAYCPSSIQPFADLPFWGGLMGGLTAACVVRAVLPRKFRLWALIGIGVLTGGLALVAGSVSFSLGERWVPTALQTAEAAVVLWLLMSCVMLGIVLESLLESHRKTLIWALVASCCNVMGVMACGTPLTLIVMGFILVCFFVTVTFAVRNGGLYPRFLWAGAVIVPLVLSVGLGVVVVYRLLLPMEAWSAAIATFGQQWSFRTGLATEVFSKVPMLGVGADGFQYEAVFFLKGKVAWSLWKAGGVGIPCDAIQLVVERGMIGTLLLLLPGLMLFGRCLLKWIECAQARHKAYSYRYIFVFAGSFLGVVVTLGMSSIGTPLHTPAVLSVFLVVCACMSGWMPRQR